MVNKEQYLDIMKRNLPHLLEKTGEDWEDTFNAISDLLFILDKDFRFVKVNKAFCDTVKKEPKELIGKYCFEVVHDRDKPWPNCPYEKTSKTKKITIEEIDDPNIGLPLLITTSPLFDDKDEVIGCIHLAQDISEQKKVEEFLRASEKKYRDLIENIPDVIYSLDLKGNITSINKASEHLLGLPPKKLIGKNITKFLPKKELPQAMALFKQIRQGKNVTAETVMVDINGKSHIVEANSKPIINNGEILGIQGIVRDITERKTIEKELKKSAFYLDTMSDILIVITPEANIVKVNKAFIDLWGYTPEEVYGKPVLTMFPKEETSKQLDEMRIAVETGTKRDFETVALTKDGKRIPLSMSGITIKDENGKLEGFLATFQNITEHKKMEEERNKLLHKYGERIKELNCILGLSELTEQSKNVEDIFKGFVELLPSAWQYPEVTCARIIINNQEYKTDNFKETKWRQQSNIVILKRNIGTVEVYYLEEKPTIAEGPFLEEERKLIDAIAERLGRLIEQKRTEERLKDLMGQLKQSNEQLKQSNIDLENYSYVVSHDLRAPLRSIKSFSSFLLEDYSNRLDDVGRDYLNRIDNAGDHMDSLIKDLLLLSRVGRKFIDIKEVNLNELLEEISSDLEVIIEENNVRIEYDELPVILVPKTWMKELFFNLIGNGIKFNQSKNPIIDVKCEDQEEDWLFMVHDNGIGIEKKYHHRIFALFERLHSKEEYPGTGAGLAICKRIIENFGGKIWVESQLGDGSTFYFSIPKKMELKK